MKQTACRVITVVLLLLLLLWGDLKFQLVPAWHWEPRQAERGRDGGRGVGGCPQTLHDLLGNLVELVPLLLHQPLLLQETSLHLKQLVILLLHLLTEVHEDVRCETLPLLRLFLLRLWVAGLSGGRGGRGGRRGLLQVTPIT